MAENTTPASRPPTDSTPQSRSTPATPADHQHVSARPGPIGSPKQNAADVGPNRRPPTEIPPSTHDISERHPNDANPEVTSKMPAAPGAARPLYPHLTPRPQ